MDVDGKPGQKDKHCNVVPRFHVKSKMVESKAAEWLPSAAVVALSSSCSMQERLKRKA